MVHLILAISTLVVMVIGFVMLLVIGIHVNNRTKAATKNHFEELQEKLERLETQVRDVNCRIDSLNGRLDRTNDRMDGFIIAVLNTRERPKEQHE